MAGTSTLTASPSGDGASVLLGTATAPRIGAGYRPALDGIRTVAVYLGVAFHAGFEPLIGGFIGVDMFFVLSGYLVTQLLLRDLDDRGSIGFKRFYSRRIRRLLPAATAALLATAVVFSAVASPSELPEAQNAVTAAALHVSNWYFIAQSVEYFGADLQSNPVVQFWSLSVEEQFYLAWPLLLGGLCLATRRMGRHRWNAVRGAVVAGMVASLAAAIWLSRTNLDRAYYGTDTRAYQLLGGALLALSPAVLVWLNGRPAVRRGLAVAALGALGGLLLLGSGILHMSPITRGALAATCTLTLIGSLEAGPERGVRWLLSRPPVVYLGKISYGTYLWHWLVIVVATRLVVDISAGALFALSALVATGMSALSFELLERPFREARRLDRHRVAVVTLGLSTSVLMGVVITPSVLSTPTDGSLEDTEAAITGFHPVPEGLDLAAIRPAFAMPRCEGEPVSVCTIVEGSGPHILLIGDSHAGMMVPTFEAVAEEHDLTLSVSVRGGCPWQRDLYRVEEVGLGVPVRPIEDCKRHKDDLYDRVVPELDPDVVVGVNLGYRDGDLTADGPPEDALEPGTEAYDEWLEQTTIDSVAALRSGGRAVVAVEPIPADLEGLHAVQCLAAAAVVEECRFIAEDGVTPLERAYRDLDAGDDHFWSLDLDRLVCPYLPICDAIVNNEVVRRDRHHLSEAFAISLAPAVSGYLERNGLLDG